MSKVITIAGQRGGSGKSVTALNLAVSLSLYEKNVLLVDCDPQGSATEWSGLGSTGYPFDLSIVLAGRATLIEAIAKTEFNYLDILPAGFDLFTVAQKLSRQEANEKILRLLMAEVKSDYDYIIMDAPSSYGFLSIAALAAADQILLTLSPRVNRVEDVHSLLKAVQHIRRTHGIPLKIMGILFNRSLGREEMDRFIDNQDLRALVCSSFIPEDAAVTAAISQRAPLVLHDAMAPACQSYLALAREMISRIQRQVR